MNSIAEEMNISLSKSSPIFYSLLSDFGKRIYMPKGIITQSAEAKKLATKYNATIGIAKENKAPMFLPSLNNYFNNLKPSEIFDYAPSAGVLDLRNKWKKKILLQNSQSLNNIEQFSTPVVTNGLTHGIMLVGDLFVEAGDEIIIPDKLWENYNLIFEERYGAVIKNYTFFDDQLKGFNINALEEAIKNSKKEKIILILNFPNNPTGYTPTEDEVNKIVKVVTSFAEKGKKIIIVCDDAYYGLLFDQNLLKGSIFSKFTGIHPNIVSIKIDGVSKEDYAWGFRIGFITFSDYFHNHEAYNIMEAKAAACIRSSISNCSLMAQSMFLNLLENEKYTEEKKSKFAILKTRALKVKEIVYRPEYSDCWDVYPFNSGYFMCLKLKDVNTEEVRTYALKNYGIGTITLGNDLRVAFSSVELEQLEDLFNIIAKCVREIKFKK